MRFKRNNNKQHLLPIQALLLRISINRLMQEMLFQLSHRQWQMHSFHLDFHPEQE